MSHKKKEVRMAVTDFSRLVDAKHFAVTLIEEGVQFSFSPSPMSISYPIRAHQPKLEDQLVTHE